MNPADLPIIEMRVWTAAYGAAYVRPDLDAEEAWATADDAVASLRYARDAKLWTLDAPKHIAERRLAEIRLKWAELRAGSPTSSALKKSCDALVDEIDRLLQEDEA